MPGASRVVRYGNAQISLTEGEPLDRAREVLYVTVNARGFMASGLAGAVRLAGGPEVEHDLRSIGSLLLGRAYLIGPGQLRDRGIEHVVCGVTTAQPGEAPKRAAVQDALRHGLVLIDATRCRSLTFPEVGTRIPGISFADAASLLVEELTSHLRRTTLLEDVVIAGLHLEYLRACRVALESAGATVVE